MPPGEDFPPTRRAALERIAAVRPQAYARTRNALDGAVSRLSPYITHGIVSLPEVLSGVARHAPGLSPQHKFVYELGWREYFRHVWQQRGDAILESLHAGPLPEEAYATGLPRDIRAGCTGVPVIDQAVRALYATGYLHNHARMWLASYVVHVRRVHWRAGADWMVAHLLDGDLASNHLSWQWVAGTASHKPYLFNAENVARHAPPDWHSPGTVIDASYAELDALAHGRSGGRAATPACEGTPVPVAEPELLIAPPDAQRMRPDTVSPDAEVWLVHPWSLGEVPAAVLERGARPGGVPGVVGLLPAAHHARWPWSAARWHLVTTRMQELTSTIWYATPEELEVALQPARSVATVDDPHIAAHLPEWVHRLPASAALRHRAASLRLVLGLVVAHPEGCRYPCRSAWHALAGESDVKLKDRFDLVIFDWAGTMVDFGCHAPVQALIEAFAAEGVTIDAPTARRDMGIAKSDHVRALLAMPAVAAAFKARHDRASDDRDVERLMQRLGPLMRDCAARASTLIPGARECFEGLRAAGLRVASSTGYTRQMMGPVLERAAAQGYTPEHLVCSGETPAGRPSPLMIYKACAELGVWPLARVVKVDDAEAGIGEGKAAGAFTVGVASGNALGLTLEELRKLDPATRAARLEAARKSLQAAGADLVLDSVAELVPALERLG